MTPGPYELRIGADGAVAKVHARGSAVLSCTTINRGTAFTLDERAALGLTGCCPPG